eukprot:4809800-Alexandrium_andersonii.AAC.1
MSASLVGSEMCIRDRWRTQCRHALQRSTCHSALQRSGMLWVGGGSQAVSYTHLTLPTICSV